MFLPPMMKVPRNGMGLMLFVLPVNVHVRADVSENAVKVICVVAALLWKCKCLSRLQDHSHD